MIILRAKLKYTVVRGDVVTFLYIYYAYETNKRMFFLR